MPTVRYEEAVPASLKPFLATEAPDEPPGPPGGVFQPGIVYRTDAQGHIITPAGRRQAAQLAGEASWQAACESEAAWLLDPETEAALQQEHDLYIGAQLKAAEIRARDADAVIAAQDEGAGAEQKPPAIYVKRGGAWMHAERARLRPGEPVSVKRPTGAWEAVGAVNASR